MQVVLEFMDKGMKGMLTGDLSVFALQQIEKSIDKFQAHFVGLASDIEAELERKQTLTEFCEEHLRISRELY